MIHVIKDKVNIEMANEGHDLASLFPIQIDSKAESQTLIKVLNALMPYLTN